VNFRSLKSKILKLKGENMTTVEKQVNSKMKFFSKITQGLSIQECVDKLQGHDLIDVAHWFRTVKGVDNKNLLKLLEY